MAKFRTEIEMRPQAWSLAHDMPIVMLGSCFTDNVGALLERDGFDVTHNPMGPLYNPASLQRAIELALGFDKPELTPDATGAWHCLDFASRYSGPDRQQLLDKVNADLQALGTALRWARTLILTLGTSYVFSMESRIVGNCHKFPSQSFTRRRLTTEENVEYLNGILALLPFNIERIIFTVSPIRHIGDGMHANQLSKASLLLAVDKIMSDTVSYFPAYELVLDDLRDYRFYASDMKHPSDTAVEYIYEKFSQAYFTPETMAAALEARRLSLRAAHRPILQ